MSGEDDSDAPAELLEDPGPAASRQMQAGEAEPPVVARMMIEIRSDGSRTIARGAMEDLSTGEKVAVEAHGRTPMHLALGLAKSIMRGRSFARSAARALLSGSKKK